MINLDNTKTNFYHFAQEYKKITRHILAIFQRREKEQPSQYIERTVCIC